MGIGKYLSFTAALFLDSGQTRAKSFWINLDAYFDLLQKRAARVVLAWKLG
jgi:hypothetical protein